MIKSFYEITFDYGSECTEEQLKELKRVVPSAQFFNRGDYRFNDSDKSEEENDAAYACYRLKEKKGFIHETTLVDLSTLARIDLGDLRCTLEWAAYSFSDDKEDNEG